MGGTQTLGIIKEVGFPTDKVVDGKNIWVTDLDASLSVLESLEITVGKGIYESSFLFISIDN